MKRYILPLLVLIISSLLRAEDFQWIQTAGYPMASFSTQVRINGVDVGSDPAGNLYVAGTFHDTATFGAIPLMATGKTDVFIAKYSPAGEVLWVKQIGSSEEVLVGGIAVDLDGNSYISGNFNVETRFVDTTIISDKKVVNYTPQYDYYLLSLDSEGNRRWIITSTGAQVIAFSDVAVSTNKLVAVVGGQTGVSDFGGMSTTKGGYFIAKINSNTGLVSSLIEDGFSIIPSTMKGIAVDNDANVAICGNAGFFAFTVGGESYVGAGLSSIFTALYDGEGGLKWARVDGGAGTDDATDVALAKDGSVIVTGMVGGDASFGTDSIVFGDEPVKSAGIIVRYSSVGEVSWLKAIRGNGVNRVNGVALLDDMVYTTGTFQIGASIDEIPFSTNASLNSSFLLELSGDGLVQDIATATSSHSVNAQSVAVDGRGNVAITGNFQVKVGWGDVEKIASTQSGQGALFEMFVTRKGSGTPIFVQKSTTQPLFSVTHNRELNLLEISQEGAYTGSIQAKIITVQGRVLVDNIYSKESKVFRLPLKQIGTGKYFLLIESGDVVVTKKLLIY